MDYIPKSLFYDKKNKDEIRIISLFLDNELNTMTKVGTDYNPIKWYEYVNP